MIDFIPYGRQVIDEDDVAAVARVLRSDWLTTGPIVPEFEEAFASAVGSRHAVAVANGTAALHLSMLALSVGPGDEVIVPSLTFAASASCARFVGASVRFADVREDTLTIDVSSVESLIGPRTRAIVAVDYAGVPCDMRELLSLCRQHGIALVSDACHAPGATYHGASVGSIADLSTFSFHPVKHLTTAEGGMVTTDDPRIAARVRQLRNHGIGLDLREDESNGTWEYDVAELGFNYRLPDLNCALGLSQLSKLDSFVARRRELAARYDELLADVPLVRTPTVPDDREPSWHLYPVRLRGDDPEALRRRAFDHLRANGVGVNVHYRPVHLHSYYARLGYEPGLTPVAEQAYTCLLSLPMWPGLTDTQQDRVVELLVDAVATG